MKTFFTEKNEEKIVGYEKGKFLLKINYSKNYSRKWVMKIPSQEGMKRLELYSKHTSKPEQILIRDDGLYQRK